MLPPEVQREDLDAFVCHVLEREPLDSRTTPEDDDQIALLRLIAARSNF